MAVTGPDDGTGSGCYPSLIEALVGPGTASLAPPPPPPSDWGQNKGVLVSGTLGHSICKSPALFAHLEAILQKRKTARVRDIL